MASRTPLVVVVGDDDAQPRRDPEVGAGPARRRQAPLDGRVAPPPVIQPTDHTGWPKMPSATSAAISVIVARSGAR